MVNEDVADHRVNADILRNGGGYYIKVINKLVEFFPFFTLGENWVEGPVVALGHGLHHDDSDNGTLVDLVAGDLMNTVGDVLQASSDGITPSIHHFCHGVGCVMESLN